MSSQNPPGGLAYPHYALIYIDSDGNLRHEASRSVANSREAILSPRVTNEFLRAVVRSGGAVASHSRFEPGAPTPPHQRTAVQPALPPQAGGVSHIADSQGVEGDIRTPMPPGPPIHPAMWPAHREPWPGQDRQQRKLRRNDELSPSSQKALMPIRDEDLLRRYYEKAFQNLQQTNCRAIAKVYVKLVEPRKQVNYAYNGRKIIAGRTQQLDPDVTKPPWWPAGVSHREPDHLPKAERIRLLVHLLCELRTSHGVTARRLKEADQPIRRQITPVERLQILDEVYQVREEEEKFLAGVTDGTALVSISRANLPDAVEASVGHGKRSQKSTSTEDSASQEPSTETVCVRSGPAQGGKVPQSAFAPGGEMPANLSPHPLPTCQSPTQYTKQQSPLHPGLDHASSSRSPQDLKRKRPYVETGLPVTTASPNSMGHNTPMFVGSQPFLTGSFDVLQNLQHPVVVPTTGQLAAEGFAENVEAYGFPYYFDP